MSRPRVFLLGAALLVLLLALTPLIPRGEDGDGLRPSGRQQSWALADAPGAGRVTPAMRAEIERHKPPASALDVKLGRGGLVDLEFALHVLQLTRHVGLDPALDAARLTAAIHTRYTELPTHTFTSGNNVLVLYDGARDPTLVPPNAATPSEIQCAIESHGVLKRGCNRRKTSGIWR